MIKLLRYAAVIFALGNASTSMAEECQLKNSSVGFLGSDGSDGKVFVALTERSGDTCDCRNIRFYENAVDTDKVLSLLLAARAASLPVQVDVKDSTDCNSGFRVFIE